MAPRGQCLLQPWPQRDCLSGGYLQPPNFIPNAEDAYNYGTIGSTIGHEIGHGFDEGQQVRRRCNLKAGGQRGQKAV